MPTFIVHPAITFLDRESLRQLDRPEFAGQTEWNEALNGNLFAIRHEKKGHLMLVPPAIERFLHSFSTENTLEKVVQEFAQETGSPENDLAPAMNRFFDDMLDRGMIVPVKAFGRWQKKMAAIHPEQKLRQVFEEGDVFEGWEIQKTLSDKKGLSVFLAENRASGQKRILKTQFAPSGLPKYARQKHRRNFMQEFSLLAELQENPGVCRLFETGETDAGFYAFLEFIEGQTPRPFLKETATDLETRLEIIRQMCGLIGFLHQKGILHGDIHLSNFLVQPNLQVRLIDFDLANHVQIRRGERLRQGGVQDYLPPEKISANTFDVVHDRADCRSEVWQLGICAYTMLHGKYPFAGFTYHELVKKILDDEPEFDPALPPQILGFLKKALSKNPVARFADGQEMAREI